MRATIFAVAVVAAVSSASAGAQQDVARRGGCLNCHAAEQTSRRMPGLSFPELAKKYGHLGADQLVKQLMDGSTKHPPIRANETQTRQIIEWMLTMK